MGAAPGFPWARWARNEGEIPPLGSESSYLGQLMMIQLGDEWELNQDDVRTRLVNWFSAVRSNWPNTILYHNNYGGQVGDAQLGDFISRAQPDMICFDSYPFRVDAASGSPYSILINWFSDLRRYREHAKGNNIPLATYPQTYYSDSEHVRSPSPSELRVQHSAALAFNCKVLIDFTYNSGSSSLFTNSSGGDNVPTPLYYEKMGCALRARNFGKTLVRLKPVTDVSFPDLRTTSMVYVRGTNYLGAINPYPIGFYAGPGGADPSTDWAYQRNDPYLTSWSVTNKGTKNSGYPGDVILSWFKTLDESFDGADYTNEVYLMVVNALADVTGTAADCQQEIKLNFASSVLALEMMNPTTGLVEVQALPLTNGVRQLVLNLAGGDAALFKFSDGAPFIGASLTGPPVITVQPASQTAVFSETVTFSGRAAGGSPVKYQWKFNGANIPGATASACTRTNVQLSDAGSYTLIASNSFGTATSSIATLTTVSNALYLYEPFDYSNIGSPVSSNTPANWTVGGSGTNDLMVIAGNLAYPGLTPSVGNSVTNGGVGLGVRRLFGTNISSGLLYFSALFRINDLGYGTWNGGATQVGAFTAPDNSSFRLQVLVKSNSPSGYAFGLQKGGTGSGATYDTTEHHAGETILLVGKYDFNASPNAVSLWVNPSPTTLGSATAPATGFISTNSGADGFVIDRFNMRQNTAVSIPAAVQWDELRVGTNWSNVTPPGAPVRVTGVTLLAGGRIQMQGSGDPGNFAIDSSTNLVNWVQVTNFVSGNGTFDFTETATNTSAQRYFRLRAYP
jgi:hypothetical protein